MAAVRALLVSTALSALALVGGAAAANPEQARLEKTLKAAMVKTFLKQAPSLRITTVACKLPANGTVAHCTASFTAGAVKGVYPVTAKLLSSGALSWTTAPPRCRSVRTNKPVACNPSNAAGYITERDAEQLFVSGGFPYQGHTIGVSSAHCTGVKGEPSRNGAFSRLTCTLAAKDKHSYRLDVVMVGPKSVSVARVTRTG
jgi:hypothetical protein